MQDATADAELVRRAHPQCPFAIDYAPQTLDDIRLAVVDAFFSLPRGGAEIGGLLMGTSRKGLITITAYAPLECEHAHGPSFTLSANDEARLKELIATAPARFPLLSVVGWYHSHTRTEINLTDADLDVHKRFFPQPWQVALVMKPHTFQPTRAGFFFRESSGAIRRESAHEEFVLTPLPAQPVPQVPAVGPAIITSFSSGGAATAAQPARIAPADPTKPPQPAPRPEPEPDPFPEPKPEPEPEPVVLAEAADPEADPDAPLVAWKPPVRSRGKRLQWTVLSMLVLVAAGAFVTRDSWVPALMARLKSSGPPPALGLHTIDQAGQLQISWDRNQPAIRNAIDATLEIGDGGPVPQAISLDQVHLQSGAFTYGRQTGRVDVKLVVHGPDGREVREVATFLGQAPPQRVVTEEDPDARLQREAAEAKMKKELDTQAARTRKLEKDLRTVKDELRLQQQRRLMNQLPEGKK